MFFSLKDLIHFVQLDHAGFDMMLCLLYLFGMGRKRKKGEKKEANIVTIPTAVIGDKALMTYLVLGFHVSGILGSLVRAGNGIRGH